MQFDDKPIILSKTAFGKPKLIVKNSFSRLTGGAGGIISPARRRQKKKKTLPAVWEH